MVLYKRASIDWLVDWLIDDGHETQLTHNDAESVSLTALLKFRKGQNVQNSVRFQQL